MTRNKILALLLACIVVTGAVTGSWVSQAWRDSTPFGAGVVLGASTDSVITESRDNTTEQVVLASAIKVPILAKYPVFTGLEQQKFHAKQYAVYNPESGRFLFTSPDMEPVPVASTTKMMTALLTVKHGKLDDVVTVPAKAAGINGSRMNLYSGEKLTVRSLLYGAMLVSGNDAALALANYVGSLFISSPNSSYEGNITRFVEEMNAEAAALHMKNTRFMDPAGLNDEGRSTATDLALLAHQLNKNETLRSIMSSPSASVSSVSGRPFELRNSNRLVNDFAFEGSLGGKTGFTPDAGHCLVSSATRNGVTLIGVALKTTVESKEASAIEVRKLLNYSFTNYRWE